MSLRRTAFLLGAVSVSACGGNREVPTLGSGDAGLAATAAPMLRGGDTIDFAPGAGGIAVTPKQALGPTSAAIRAHVALPAHADEPFSVAVDAMSVVARLQGAGHAPSQIVGDRVRYVAALEGATIEHAPTHEGTEEWIRFEHPPTSRELHYDVGLHNVAGLRLVADTLELLDASGAPRLRVNKPVAIDAKGARRAGTLGVEGCAVDRDVNVPFGRPVTAPGSDRCTVVARFDDAGLAYPIVVDPAWTTTGSLATARYGATAVATKSASGTCSSGCVVVVGGLAGGSPMVAPEVWDASKGTWASAPIPSTVSWTATSGSASADLGGGMIVLAGGAAPTPGPWVADVVTWDAVAGWTQRAPLPFAIYNAKATTIAGYGALMAGGKQIVATTDAPIDNVWIMPAAAPTGWTAAHAMAATHGSPLVTAYALTTTAPIKFTVAVADGDGSGTGVDYGSFDTSTILTNTWHSDTGVWTTPMTHVARVGSTSYFLGEGAAKLASIDHKGSFGACFSAPCPPSPLQNVSGAMLTTGYSRAAAAANDDRVLLIGGVDKRGLGPTILSAVDYYFPTGATPFATDATALATARTDTTAVSLPDGRAMAIGGDVKTSTGYAATASVEILGVSAKGSACGSDGECTGTLRCVDGVCCDVTGAATANCAGQCESCVVPGKVGTCAPQPAGSAPATGHKACSTPTGGTCGYQCDGVDATGNRNACHLPGTETSCAASTCTGSTQTSSACDGAGSCAAHKTACGHGLACDATAGVCRSSCSGNSDCQTGFACKANACVPATGSCSADRTSSVSADGATTKPCAPYFCDPGSGACTTSCATTADCQTGNSCGSDGKCAPSTSTSDSHGGGGCSMHGREGGANAVWLVVASAALAFAKARRRRVG